jgi:hypothetical protein
MDFNPANGGLCVFCTSPGRVGKIVGDRNGRGQKSSHNDGQQPFSILWIVENRQAPGPGLEIEAAKQKQAAQNRLS